MKCAVLLLLMVVTSSLITQAAPQTGTGVVQGLVVRVGTSEPISDVQITVTPAATTGPSPAARPPALAAISDPSGRFVVRDVPAGNVMVRAQLTGYFGTAVNGVSPAVVTAPAMVVVGQAVDVRLSMVPGGTISGRVIDAGGKPLPDIPVQALRVGYQDGNVVPQAAGSRNTGDRGEYRIFRLPPGEYFVAVVPEAPWNLGAPSSAAATAAPARETPVRTLYPNVTDFSASIPVAVRAGEESPSIDIRVKTAVNVTVSGRITSTLPPGPVVRAITTTAGAAGTVRPFIADLALISRDKIDDIALVVTAKEDNTFELRNVRPGFYELVARLPAATGWGEMNPPGLALGAVAFGRTSVEVRDGNVENLNIVVHQGVDLKGVVTVDGRPVPAALRLSLQPNDAATRTGVHSGVLAQVAAFQPSIAPDGSFTIPMLPEARYRFQIVLGAAPQQLTQTVRVGQEGTNNRVAQTGLTPLPATAYIADIRQSGNSIYDNGLDVGPDSLAPIQVLINTDPGSLEGLVLNSEKKPAINAFVVLVPAPSRRQNPALYRTTRSDAQGRFALTTVPPGSYKVFAWESVQPGAYQNAAFLAKVEERGAPVTIAPNSRVSANVSLIQVGN